MTCKVYLGDCRRVMENLQKESIDLVVTSPPYWGLRDYNIESIIFDGKQDCKHEWCLETTAGDIRFRGNNSIVGNNANPEIWKGTGKGHFCSLCGAWKGQLGLEPSPELFVKHLIDAFALVKPILKSTGSVFINLGDTYSSSGSNNQPTHTSFGKLTNPGYKTEGHRANLPPKCLCGIPARFEIEMVNRGWILRNRIIWHKPNHLPESVKDRLTKSYEFVYHFVKQRSYYYNLDGIREPHKESSKERILRAVSNSHKYTGCSECGGGGSGISKPRTNRRTKIPSNEAEIFGSPRARYHREHNSSISQYQYGEGDYLVVNLHPKGKNPGDVWDIPEEQSESQRVKTQETKFNDSSHNASSLTKSRDKYRSEGVPEGHPLGKNPGDVWEFPEKPEERTQLARQRGLEKGKLHHGDFNEQYLSLGLSNPLYPLGKNPGDLWSITTKPFRGAHFAVFPEDIPRKCIIAACPGNGFVLDPFAGAGTTLKVAKELKRNAIGIELNPDYVKIIQKRLNHECEVIGREGEQ